jgi:heat shock protein HslJ
VRHQKPDKWMIVVLLALGTLLGACGSSENPDPTNTPARSHATATPGSEHLLEGTEWMLASLRGQSPLEGSQITLAFKDGGLGGFAGCNAYGGGPDSGRYITAGDGSLTIPEIAITAMACLSPQGIMEQEQAYVEALRRAAIYRLADSRLEIQDASGETILIFARQEDCTMEPSDLVGTTWQLVSIDGQDPVQGSAITLAFYDEHRVGGHAGCRDYVALYEAEGNDLGFDYTAMLGAVCQHEGLLEQEGAYTTILGWTAHYRLDEGQLELRTVRGEALVEEMPAPLPLPSDLLPGTEITATFEDGTARGSAGCNTYNATLAHDGSLFTFESIAFTEMACLTPDGVMSQEQRYLDLLRDVVTFHVYGAQLWLETGDGRALVFGVRP